MTLVVLAVGCGAATNSGTAGELDHSVELGLSKVQPIQLPPNTEVPFDPPWSVFKQPLKLQTAQFKAEALRALRVGTDLAEADIRFFFDEWLAKVGIGEYVDWTGPRAIVPITLRGFESRQLFLSYFVTAAGFNMTLLVERTDHEVNGETITLYEYLSTNTIVLLRNGVTPSRMKALADAWAVQFPQMDVNVLENLGIITLDLKALVNPEHELTKAELAEVSDVFNAVSAAPEVESVEGLTPQNFDIESFGDLWKPLALGGTEVELNSLRTVSFAGTEEQFGFTTTLPAFRAPFGNGPVPHPVWALEDKDQTVHVFIKHGEDVNQCAQSVTAVSPVFQRTDVYGWAFVRPKAAEIASLQKLSCIGSLTRMPLIAPGFEIPWSVTTTGSAASCRKQVGRYLKLQSSAGSLPLIGNGDEAAAFLVTQLDCVTSVKPQEENPALRQRAESRRGAKSWGFMTNRDRSQTTTRSGR